jgi:hypothetical protein
MLHKKIFEKKNNKVGKNKFYNEQKQVKKQSNVTVNFIRMCHLFYKTFSKMTHLTETQRIEILILIGCGEFLHKLAFCQQAGGWQFEHLIP